MNSRQINFGGITQIEELRIDAIMHQMGLKIGHKINKRALFFILLDEKEKELFGENKAENFYIEKKKDALPVLKTREEVEMKYTKIYQPGYLDATPKELEDMIKKNTDREMEKQEREQEEKETKS